MEDNQLVSLSKSFAVKIIKLCDDIKAKGKNNAVISQLLRSGTSIGANIHEAMEEYYSIEEQKKYGVLGIEISRSDGDSNETVVIARKDK